MKGTVLLYYIGMISYILFFMNTEVIWTVPLFLFWGMLSMIILTFLLCLSVPKYTIKQLIFISIIFVIVLISGYNCKRLILFYSSFALIIGAKDMVFRKLLYCHFICIFLLLFVSYTGSQIGMIKDFTTYESYDKDLLPGNSGIRHSLGYVWPTGFGIHASFVCLVWFLLRKGKLGFISIALFLFLSYLSMAKCNCRQGVLGIVTLIFFSFLLRFKITRNYLSRLSLFAVFFIPVCFVFSLCATLLYDESNLTWIIFDLLIGNRLRLGQAAVEKYGISMFGQYFEMTGGDSGLLEYNYIDNSFIQSLVLGGWLVTIIMVGIYTFTSYNAYKRQDLPFVVAIIFSGLSGLSSQYTFQLMCCPLMIALFAKLGDKKFCKKYEKRRFKESDTRVDTRVLS